MWKPSPHERLRRRDLVPQPLLYQVVRICAPQVGYNPTATRDLAYRRLRAWGYAPKLGVIEAAVEQERGISAILFDRSLEPAERWAALQHAASPIRFGELLIEASVRHRDVPRMSAGLRRKLPQRRPLAPRPARRASGGRAARCRSRVRTRDGDSGDAGPEGGDADGEPRRRGVHRLLMLPGAERAEVELNRRAQEVRVHDDLGVLHRRLSVSGQGRFAVRRSA
jgi:hypothetical protein